jgi:hypothetical protein
MPIHTFWSRIFARKFGSRRHKQRYRTRLLLEALEDRCVPTTITPTTFADGVLGSGSLRDAVLQFNTDAGTGDDTILLEAGTYSLTIQNVDGYHETAGLTGDLNMTQTSHHWIIQGAGASTIIDASQLQDRVFQIVNPGTQVVFQNLVIQGGLAQDDGSDGALAGSTDALGGGILNNGGTVTLDHVVLQNNVARGGDVSALGVPGHNARGGGIYSTGGALTITGATIANNQVIGGRGGDHNGPNAGGNGGSVAGGGLYATGGSLDISASTIANNRATGGRGGDGILTFGTPSGYTQGTGGTGGSCQGGGLYVNGGSLTIATSTFGSNQGNGGSGGAYGFAGTGLGGGLSNGGTLTVSDSTLSGNSATGPGSWGGGINNDYPGTLTVSNSTLSRNSAHAGGGIGNAGTLTVSNSTLSGNSASNALDQGGGILNVGTVTVSNSTLSGNSAAEGGGIYNYTTLTVSNSTLSGNTATGYYDGYYYGGGGIFNGYPGTLTVSNSTLSGNTATGDGGGIYAPGTHPVTLTNVTLTANRANTGGGSYHGGGLFVNSSPLLHNTLIAGNFRGATGTTRDDVFGALNSGSDYNLIGDGTGMTGLQSGVNGNQVGSAAAPIDPMLGPLQNNGGPTFTHALLARSPALNAGNSNQLGVADQRGVERRGGVNIGAYQASASAFVVTVSGTVASGMPFDVTVQAVDVFGQVAFGYRGTVTFSVTDPDPAVVLPADYTFSADDQGRHTFSGAFTLITPGDQTLTVADLADTPSTDVPITVNA